MTFEEARRSCFTYCILGFLASVSGFSILFVTGLKAVNALSDQVKAVSYL
jgi:hypothetical protein